MNVLTKSPNTNVVKESEGQYGPKEEESAEEMGVWCEYVFNLFLTQLKDHKRKVNTVDLEDEINISLSVPQTLALLSCLGSSCNTVTGNQIKATVFGNSALPFNDISERLLEWEKYLSQEKSIHKARRFILNADKSNSFDLPTFAMLRKMELEVKLVNWKKSNGSEHKVERDQKMIKAGILYEFSEWVQEGLNFEEDMVEVPPEVMGTVDVEEMGEWKVGSLLGISRLLLPLRHGALLPDSHEIEVEIFDGMNYRKRGKFPSLTIVPKENYLKGISCNEHFIMTSIPLESDILQLYLIHSKGTRLSNILHTNFLNQFTYSNLKTWIQDTQRVDPTKSKRNSDSEETDCSPSAITIPRFSLLPTRPLNLRIAMSNTGLKILFQSQKTIYRKSESSKTPTAQGELFPEGNLNAFFTMDLINIDDNYTNCEFSDKSIEKGTTHNHDTPATTIHSLFYLVVWDKTNSLPVYLAKVGKPCRSDYFDWIEMNKKSRKSTSKEFVDRSTSSRRDSLVCVIA